MLLKNSLRKSCHKEAVLYCTTLPPCTKETSYAILFLSYIIENCLLSKLYIYSPAIFEIVVMGLLTCKT